MKYCPKCATPLLMQTIHRQERLACPSSECGFIHWENPTPVVAMLVETNMGVILARNVSWPRHFYSIITGFLEKGEDPIDCAIRETREELNLRATRCELIGAYPFEMQNQVIIGYHVEAEGDIRLNEELDDYKLIVPEQLKSWDIGTGLVVKDWLEKRLLLQSNAHTGLYKS